MATPGPINRPSQLEKTSLCMACLFSLLPRQNSHTKFSDQIRILNGFFAHLKNRQNNPSLLFQPVIISSRTSLLECDYNFHKSNSTYFSDLDISRMHTMMCFFKPGLEKWRKQAKTERNAKFFVALGGVTCTFKKEIKPYQGFEIWTRILSWDRKWLYLVSHVVEKGKVKPKGYVLQPWRRWIGKKVIEEKRIVNPEEERNPHPAIFATSIAKYVFKEGRLTVPPETVLLGCDLLPSKPPSLETPPTTASPAIETTSIEVTAATAAAAAVDTLTPSNAEQDLEAALIPRANGEVWDWWKIEDERARGMRVAGHMAGLDGLFMEFTADTGSALGEY